MCEICANDSVASHSVVTRPTLASTLIFKQTNQIYIFFERHMAYYIY